MSRSRRFFDPDEDHAYRGPSDEMLAVDAATEMRSMTLLYERWADRLYRYFLLSTGDPGTAERMMRELVNRLPAELQKFAGDDRSFGGWLFIRASEIFWREYSFSSRMYRRVSRYIPARASGSNSGDQGADPSGPVLAGFEEMADGLAGMAPDRREVLGIHFGAELKTASAAEALRIPASLISSHIQWALESLGEQLDISSTRRLSEDLTGLIGRQTLSSQERQRHFSMIHGLFLGEAEVESDEPERAPIFEIGALIGVVVLGLIGIWVWGLITEGDTREHEVATSPPVETASEPDPTPTPTVVPEPTEEPTPEPTPAEVAMDGEVGAVDNGICLAAEGKAVFDRFVSNYNDGDFADIHQMLPQSPVRSTDDDADYNAFFVHGDTEITFGREVTSFLRERYNEGERWDVLEAYPAEHYRNWQAAAPLEMYQDWKRENPGLSMIIVAGMDVSGDDDDLNLLQGRVIVDCEEGQIVDWDLPRNPSADPGLVSVEEFVSVMEDLEPGEARSVQAQVLTDSRPDGGSLGAWAITWSEAANDDGERVERVDVETLDGDLIASYVSDGNQWRIDQRGWLLFGREEDSTPLPDEIELAVPWLDETAYVLARFDDDMSSVSSMTINEDYTHTAGPGAELHLQIRVSEGNVNPIRVLDRTFDGDRARPEIYLTGVSRSDDFDPDAFEIEQEPDFPELDTQAARYDVPDTEWDQLSVISMSVGGDQAVESYRIEWNDVAMDLNVRPSRGGLDLNSIPPTIDESWTTASADYRWGTLVWAHRQFAGYPTEALWDDGRYLFELAVDRDAISADHDWSLRELTALADALSGDDAYFGDNSAVSGISGGAVRARGVGFQ